MIKKVEDALWRSLEKTIEDSVLREKVFKALEMDLFEFLPQSEKKERAPWRGSVERTSKASHQPSDAEVLCHPRPRSDIFSAVWAKRYPNISFAV
jgi:hypothetical protein